MSRAQLLKERQVRELERVSARGVRAMSRLEFRVRAETLRAFRAKRSPVVKEMIERALFPVLRDASIAAYLTGFRRELITANQSVKGLKLAVFDDVLRGLSARAGLSVKELRELYGAQVADIARDASEVAQEELRQTVTELIAEGAHVSEGVNTLTEGFERADIKGVKPFRLESIFRTQTQVAYGAGRWQADQDPAIQEILWGYEYTIVGDDRVRPSHEAVEGTRLPKDDSFWQSWWPPNGWNCRCQAISIFEKEATIEAPPDVQPDQGFDQNVGTLTAAPLDVKPRRVVKPKRAAPINETVSSFSDSLKDLRPGTERTVPPTNLLGEPGFDRFIVGTETRRDGLKVTQRIVIYDVDATTPGQGAFTKSIAKLKKQGFPIRADNVQTEQFRRGLERLGFRRSGDSMIWDPIKEGTQLDIVRFNPSTLTRTSEQNSVIADTFDFLPTSVKQDIPLPPIELDERIAGGSYQLGTIKLDPSASRQRMASNFMHEYGHHVDSIDKVTDTREFTIAFGEARSTFDTNPYKIPKRTGSPAQGLMREQADQLNVALSNGKAPSVTGTGHSSEFFREIEGADKKEAFAASFNAWTMGDSGVQRAYPSLFKFLADTFGELD